MFVEIDDIFDFSAAPSIVFSIAHTTIHSKCGVEQFVCPQSVLSVGAARPGQPWHATNMEAKVICTPSAVEPQLDGTPARLLRDQQRIMGEYRSTKKRLTLSCKAFFGAPSVGASRIQSGPLVGL